ncbi:membrane protein [Bacteroidia bacterium]|nr:membrane protein [Bacteroidia bacterium]GHV44948.1 membrane protein [Bacteroidia bacterium]
MNQNKTEILIGKSLRVGVVISVVITLTGGFLYLFQHQGLANTYKAIPQDSNTSFEGAAVYLREFSTIVPRIFQFDGAAIIQLGVIVLIATPILRVILSLITFLMGKDKLYVLITAIVLIVILSNMFFGIH